ncbi:MAG: ribonuclease protein component [Acidimicrobiales bacterium]|nr:ribonuclease protein component [Acidimicrobiales bacterium]
MRRGPLSVAYLADDDGEPVRVAYAIGKRVGGAVVRNRLRRRLRAVLAELADDPELLPSGAMVISAGPEVTGRTPDELRNDVRSLLEALQRRRSAADAR